MEPNEDDEMEKIDEEQEEEDSKVTDKDQGLEEFMEMMEDNIEGEFNPYYYYQMLVFEKMKTTHSNPDWKLQLNFKEIFEENEAKI